MSSGQSHFGHHGGFNWGIYFLGIIIVAVTFCVLCEMLRTKRKRGSRRLLSNNGPTVTVTTTTQQSHLTASPQVMPPYPIDARHPTPANAPGFAPHHAPYPTHAPSMPFPQGQTPYQSGGAPYPPAPYQSTDYSANPPPYDVAVAQPPMQPPSSKDGYQKQSPYNPGYN